MYKAKDKKKIIDKKFAYRIGEAGTTAEQKTLFIRQWKIKKKKRKMRKIRAAVCVYIILTYVKSVNNNKQ